MIAIPIAMGYNYFVAVNDRFVTEMEESAGELIDAIMKVQQK
jgi:biopolymer transport protein ExbB/TolQ